jgi:hypothetical protein
MSSTARSRGLALSPLVAILALALLGLIGWKLAIQLGHIPTGRPDAGQLRGKYITISIVTALFILGCAGGVGALAYFLFGQSESAAAIGMAIPISLGVATFSIQHYRYIMRPSPTAPQTAPEMPAAPSPAPRPPPTPAPVVQRPPALPPPRASESVAIQPEPTTPRTVAPSPPPTPRPADPADSPAAKAALESLRAEVAKDCADLATQAQAMYESLARTPKPIKTELDARIKLAQDVRDAASRLQERIVDLREEAAPRLEEAGVDRHSAAMAAGQFSISSGFSEQQAAAFHLVHFVDQALEESNLLRDNLGRWVLRNGKLATSDKDLERRYESARFFVEAGLGRREDILGPLRR